MRPKKAKSSSKSNPRNDFLTSKFPGLAIPNDAKPKFKEGYEISTKDEFDVKEEPDEEIDAAMAELEALAPSKEK